MAALPSQRDDLKIARRFNAGKRPKMLSPGGTTERRWGGWLRGGRVAIVVWFGVGMGSSKNDKTELKRNRILGTEASINRENTIQKQLCHFSRTDLVKERERKSKVFVYSCCTLIEFYLPALVNSDAGLSSGKPKMR